MLRFVREPFAFDVRTAFEDLDSRGIRFCGLSVTCIGFDSFFPEDNFQILFPLLPETVTIDIRSRFDHFDSLRLCIFRLFITSIDLYPFIDQNNRQVLFQQLHQSFGFDV
jgi:hypothetical protein